MAHRRRGRLVGSDVDFALTPQSGKALLDLRAAAEEWKEPVRALFSCRY